MNQYKISSIPENGCKGLSIKHGDYEIKVIIVRKGATIFCYHNICPHTGINLDWIPDQFLDITGKLIQCSTHGALFQIEDGYCISGPCTGQKLLPLKLKIEEDMFEILLK
jgi:naringenin degradation protein FdeD